MAEYLLRLALLLPLMALLIWCSLKLSRYLQSRLNQTGTPGRTVRVVETSLIAPGMRLAVVRFREREVLIGCTRQGMVRLSEVEALPEGEAACGVVAEQAD